MEQQTITALKAQKRNPQRVNVYLDGKFAFGLARVVAGWLTVGQKLSADKIERLQADDVLERAYQRALNFLSYRVRSDAEVRQNLRKKKVDEEVIEAVMEKLRRNKLVDDQEFARQWVENRSEFRPRGRRALAFELRQKNVAQDVIDTVLDNVDEEALAYKAAQKKAPRIKTKDWHDFRKKLGGFLARRGFNYSTISPVLKKLWSERTENIV